MSRARIALGLVLIAAGVLPAQSVPPIMKSKETATRAVEATNAHTAAMTGDTTSRTRPAPAPAAPAPASAAASAASGVDSATGSSGIETQSAGGSAAVPKTAEREASGTFEREVFDYRGAGRRDPFVSLMSNGDLRPVITDLKVAGIVFDESSKNSVAILIDVSSKEQYRVRVGQSIGRIRVARIDSKSVTFTIEEFGFSRQETLTLADPNKERTQ